MSYRFKSDTSIDDNVKRIANEQIESSIYQLTVSIKANRARAIHNARKHFKKARALVRLVRDEVGSDAYKRENVCFRDAGRKLSDIRDAQVRMETLDDLMARYQVSIDGQRFTGIRQVLEQAYDQALDTAMPDREAIATIVSDLEAAQDRIHAWRIHNNWQSLRGNIERVYNRGYSQFFRACDQPTPEHLHEWRKRVKYLWYHLRLISPLWPNMMDVLKNDTKALSDFLGDDHDLANLRTFITDDPERFAEDEPLGVLLALIQRRQLELQTQARFYGQRIYAEAPTAFVARLEQYWSAWQAEQEQPPITLPSPSDAIHDLPTARLHQV